MVVLVAKINKLYSKLENFHHHHQSQSSESSLSASFEVFLSDVSDCLSKFSSLSSKPRPEMMSFSWIQQCFELIPITNKAFAKLVVAIDHPLSKWGASSVEEYLNYNLNLLELFNSITSSISHLGQSKISLSFALSLEEKSPTLALKHLKPIQQGSLNKECLRREKEKERDREEKEKGSCSSKEEVIQKALMVVESLGFWVCGVVLSCLGSGDNSKACFEMKKFGILDSSVFEAIVEKKSGELKEVKEVNESVACLVDAVVANGKSSGELSEELRRRLEMLEEFLEGFGNEVDGLFHEVLRRRNQVLHGFQQRKMSPPTCI